MKVLKRIILLGLILTMVSSCSKGTYKLRKEHSYDVGGLYSYSVDSSEVEV